jgi:hypothetical protein
MKKEATLKLKGLKRKTSDEKKRQPQNVRGAKERSLIKKGNPEMQEAQKKTSDEEIGNPKYKGHKKDL